MSKNLKHHSRFFQTVFDRFKLNHRILRSVFVITVSSLIFSCTMASLSPSPTSGTTQLSTLSDSIGVSSTPTKGVLNFTALSITATFPPSAHLSQSQNICRLGILAPLEPRLYGLENNHTVWTTLNLSLEEARDMLNGECEVESYVSYVSCTMSSTLMAVISDPLDKADVLIGPPCFAAAIIISLINKPVVTWIPLLDNLDLEFQGYAVGQQGDQSREDGTMPISSFGRYDDLAKSVLLTLKYFQWSKIASVYSQDEFCRGFHGVMTGLLDSSMITARHLGFDPANTSTIDQALASVRDLFPVLVTCSSPDAFADLLTSAERLEMTSGNYVIVHVTMGTWPKANEVLKSDNFHMRLYSSVLFVDHFNKSASGVKRGSKKLKTEMDVSYSEQKLHSAHPRGQFLDYFYDAILLWAAAQKRTVGGQPLHFSNLTLTGENHTGGRTGLTHLNEEGVRQLYPYLLHYQGGQLVKVADLAGDFTLLRPIDWPGGRLPSDTFVSSPEESNSDKIIGGVLGTLFVLLILLLAVFLFRRWRLDRLSQGRSWQVDDREVKRRQTHVTLQNGTPHQRRLMRMETRGTLGLGSICSLDRSQLFAPVGNYRGTAVAVKTIQCRSFRLTPSINTDLNILKELTHDNINTFVGAHVEPGNTYVLFKYCAKGSLQDVLENEDITLDWMFKMSFATDLARGMEYIHKSALKSHGNLKSSNCVIDSRWVLKITDFGAVMSSVEEQYDDMSHHALYNALLWTAPELLRLPALPGKGTQKGDVFSFAIVLQEILFRVGPYGYDCITPEEIVENVKKGKRVPFRPHIPEDPDIPEKALTLMMSCWDESPEQRPEFRIVRKRLFDLNGGKKLSMLDNMLSLMETYSSRLEQLVADRTAELAQEKVKTDRLLYQMLPLSVAEQLKSGKPVVPEFYEAVSIFFSDIVGFTTIASQSKPLEIVDLLNDLYTAFDDVIYRRDVYKVETIGDAYMCVSGCPRRNGQRHTSEIAEMALDLVATVSSVKVRHRPHESLQLRVGLHTGPCAAGVVGVAMPRYCLFGDTVNMASRMESTGKALHIHISSEMRAALEELDCGFLTLERGMIQVKGKGIHKTFWLVGKKGYTKTLPDTFSKLRQTLEEANPRPPSSSNTSLTVGDGMYSALRKTSLAVSHITVTSDSDDGIPGSPVRSESGVDTTFPCPRMKHRGPADSTTQNDDVFNQTVDADNKHVTIGEVETADPKHGTIPRIEIS